MIRVGIVGAAGYAGASLLQILLSHPKAEVVWLSSEEAHYGKKISEIRPFLFGINDLTCHKIEEIPELVDLVDLVIMALPNGLAMKLSPMVLQKGKKVIDISADFRIKDLNEYTNWYKIEHLSPELVEKAVYGLPELFFDKIKNASLIANPGCYPTASILGAAPLLKYGIVKDESIVIDAKSGVSGAGATLTEVTHFPECNENFRAYAVASHRHNPEIDQILGQIANKKITTTFVPHLVPMNRGILATIYGSLSRSITIEELYKLYKDFYKNAPFVRILEVGKLPATKYVYNSNYCDIGFTIDKRANRVIVLSAIDNLVKGAAGQAIQNMNIMFNFDERMGLDRTPIYP